MTATCVFVTGATGFVGLHLVQRLVDAGCDVTALARASSPTAALERMPVRIARGDVTDAASLEAALRGRRFEVVYHLAGVVRAIRRSAYRRVNVAGVEHLAAAAARCAAPPTLVHVSTLAAVGPSTPQRPHVEADACAPVSEYGRTKLAGEAALRRYARQLPITIVRPPIVMGPRDVTLLPVLRTVAKRGLYIAPSAASHRVSMVHVQDLADALIAAAARGRRLGADGDEGVYFAAADEMPSHAELASLLADASGRDGVRCVAPPRWAVKAVAACGSAWGRLRGRPVLLHYQKAVEVTAGSWTCDNAKARRDLGFAPPPLRQRIAETIEWNRSAGMIRPASPPPLA